MADDDLRNREARQGPSVILVEPQLGENIGTAARAMANGGLEDLRLVRPREGWPNRRARATASGADQILENAGLFETAAAAVADLRKVYATTARPRDMVKPCSTPRKAVAAMRSRRSGGRDCGVLFGPERTGLTNDHLVLASEVIVIPAHPEFTSLNLAQAVLVLGYEWFQSGNSRATDVPDRFQRDSRPATSREVQDLFSHLEKQLDAAGFFYPPEKRPAMIRNLRNIFLRTDLTEQEVRTLHGMIKALSGKKWEDLE